MNEELLITGKEEPTLIHRPKESVNQAKKSPGFTGMVANCLKQFSSGN